jgi:hypothetical protein
MGVRSPAHGIPSRTTQGRVGSTKQRQIPPSRRSGRRWQLTDGRRLAIDVVDAGVVRNEVAEADAWGAVRDLIDTLS